MCVRVHQSTQELALEFYEELRRRYYITPKSYLDLIALYLEALGQKRKDKEKARSRLANGLNKLALLFRSVIRIPVRLIRYCYCDGYFTESIVFTYH